MATVLSLMVLVALALLAGAIFVWRRGARKQAALMVVLALVMAVNVAIWAVPTGDGETLTEAKPQ
jgi:hypothetical protein